MMNMNRILTGIRSSLLFVAAGLTVAVSSAARGQCQYEVTAVFEGPDCWGSPAPIYVRGLNEHGHIVGYYTCILAQYPFVWKPDTGLETLPILPGYAGARAYDINDNGDIVGYMELPNGGRCYACMWKDGEAIDLGTLPDANWSEALAINNQGQVVGYANNTSTGPLRAFLWEDGEMIDLSPILGTEDSEAHGINERGWITGWMGSWLWYDSRAFIIHDDSVTDLGVPPDGTGAYGADINEKGWVAGVGYVDLYPACDLYRRGILHRWGRMVDLGTLPQHMVSAAGDINDRGQVVGSSGTGYHAILWQNEQLLELDTLIPMEPELHLHNAGGINSTGQIAVRGTNAAGNWVGALLTPREAVMGDVDGNCQVDVDDLFGVLGYWGPCEGCPEDLNEDGIVNLKDLLVVIMNWGKDP